MIISGGGSKEQYYDPTTRLKICSLNACIWPNYFVQKLGVSHQKQQRLDDIISFITEEAFDLVFLQEVYQESHYEQLQNELVPLGYYFYIGEYSYALTSLWHRFNLSGLCILAKQRLIARDQQWFAAQGSLDSLLGIPRSCLSAVLENSNLLVVNTHFTPSYSAWLPGWDHFESIIQSQLKELYALLHKRLTQKQHNPLQCTHWMLGGDFNVDYRSALFQEKNPLLRLQGCSVTDLVEGSCNNQVEFARDWEPSVSCVDLILTNLRIVSQSKPKLNISDHFPLVCIVEQQQQQQSTSKQRVKAEASSAEKQINEPTETSKATSSTSYRNSSNSKEAKVEQKEEKYDDMIKGREVQKVDKFKHSKQPINIPKTAQQQQQQQHSTSIDSNKNNYRATIHGENTTNCIYCCGSSTSTSRSSSSSSSSKYRSSSKSSSTTSSSRKSSCSKERTPINNDH
jgi:endonuclease/exonuclease/phosphatase family metal-dependent hydrolase